MTHYSYSRVELFKQCPYRYKLKYIDNVKTYPKYDADNPLICGTALHHCVEKDTETALNEYCEQYPIITDKHINEMIKIEIMGDKLRKEIPYNTEYETELKTDEFIGYIDGLNGTDIYDFKYSAKPEKYRESGQLSIYKYYYEQIHPERTINNLIYLVAPKVYFKQEKDESLNEFRDRIKNTLNDVNIEKIKVEYDPAFITDFKNTMTDIEKEKEYKKKPSKLCSYCEYENYCYSEGKNTGDLMKLPDNKRTTEEKQIYKRIWIYGKPFIGKSYLCNQINDVLFINTDGNAKLYDAPSLLIKDEMIRETTHSDPVRKYAWENFEEVVTELEKQNNTFKCIVIDLLSDLYEMCRTYMLNKLKITHESDSGYGKGYALIKKRFQDTLQRLLSLNYDIILLSHEDDKDAVAKENGASITKIAPSGSKTYGDWLAGRMDFCARIVIKEGVRKIEFKNSNYVFGGKRLNIKETYIPCNWENVLELYKPTTKE